MMSMYQLRIWDRMLLWLWFGMRDIQEFPYLPGECIPGQAGLRRLLGEFSAPALHRTPLYTGIRASSCCNGTGWRIFAKLDGPLVEHYCESCGGTGNYKVQRRYEKAAQQQQDIKDRIERELKHPWIQR
jgi:hypothetical protein